jgi:uncharacterized protein with PIN domain
MRIAWVRQATGSRRVGIVGPQRLTGGQEYCPYLSTSPATFLEAAIVIEARLGDPGSREFDLWLHRAEVEMLPVDARAG